MLRSKLFYALLLAFFGTGIWLIIASSSHFFPHAYLVPEKGNLSENLLTGLIHHLRNPLPILLIQVVLVVTVARLFAIFFRRIGQPIVVREIGAGIALGPSLLGWIFPETAGVFFPKESLQSLGLISQIGLIHFMFLIGMEVDVGKLKNKIESAVVISHASIMFPFLLGMGLAFYLYPRFSDNSISFLSFSLFIGISMSITAFPVLARILQDHALSSTRTGSVVLACAAADDVTAWSILAVVLALVRSGGIISGLVTLALAIFYIALMLKFIQPLLKQFSNIYVSSENLSRGALTVVFIFIFSSSLLTELIGIHALFGAFLAGVIMPSGQKLKELIAEKIRDFSMLVLLPLFFAFTGLRTSIGLLNSTHLWIVTFLVIFVAVFGKLGGSVFAARFVGESWRDSFAIGTLMNTRGLMELVVLNIGYDLGIISSTVFSMMVLMALATTVMTGPLLGFILRRFPEGENPHGGIMISYAAESMGFALARVSEKLFSLKDLTMMHFNTGSKISSKFDSTAIFDEQYEREDFDAHSLFKNKIKSEIRYFNKIDFIYRSTENILHQIVHEVEKENPKILLIGSARGVFLRNITGGLVRQILMKVKCNVGIYNGTDRLDLQNVLIIASDGAGWIKTILKSRFKSNSRNVTIITPEKITADIFNSPTFIILEMDIYEDWSAYLTQSCLIIRPNLTDVR